MNLLIKQTSQSILLMWIRKHERVMGVWLRFWQLFIPCISFHTFKAKVTCDAYEHVWLYRHSRSPAETKTLFAETQPMYSRHEAWRYVPIRNEGGVLNSYPNSNKARFQNKNQTTSCAALRYDFQKEKDISNPT